MPFMIVYFLILIYWCVPSSLTCALCSTGRGLLWWAFFDRSHCVSYIAIYLSFPSIYWKNLDVLWMNLLTNSFWYMQFHIYSRQRIKQVLLGSCSIGGYGKVMQIAVFFFLYWWWWSYWNCSRIEDLYLNCSLFIFSQIATAFGPCGNNRDYLFLLEKAMFDIGEQYFYTPTEQIIKITMYPIKDTYSLPSMRRCFFAE